MQRHGRRNYDAVPDPRALREEQWRRNIRMSSGRNHPKVRFWIWLVATTAMVILVSWLSDFMNRCTQAGVFSSLTFKWSLFFLLISLVMAGFILHISGEYQFHKPRNLWKYHKWLFGSTILFVAICIVLFTVSLYPAYNQACISYGCLGAIFITNLACLLLY